MMELTLNDLNKVGTQNRDRAIRQLRQPLLDAYDIYKTSVAFGEIPQTTEECARVLEWAQGLRDMKVEGFYNIPDKVLYYVKDKARYNK